MFLTLLFFQARRKEEEAAIREKAEKEAATMPDFKEIEDRKVLANLEKMSLEEVQIRPDGHCLYAAFADQIKTVLNQIVCSIQC